MSIESELLDFLLKQSVVEKIDVPSGVVISRKGDVCNNLVIVLEGRVKVYHPAENGKSLTLYYIENNDSCILTASCILNQEPFPAFAETISCVNALSIPLREVKKWLETEPLWRKYIFRLLSQRMVNLIELVNSVAFTSLDSRLAEWLMAQLSVARLSNEPSQILVLTHQSIAEELASSREVISRLLKNFEKEGVIALRRGEIEIRDKAKLQVISEAL